MTREEAIKALTMERKTALHENKQAFDMAIKALEQEPRWILDNERCPEKTGRYLITYYNRYQDTTETQEAFFVEEDDEFKWYDTTEIEITLAVIAWMPLPAPYEPQESEDEK